MHFASPKGILSSQNGMNLYRGCTHGCIYCDARSDCYKMTHAFEDIEVKINAPQLLENALKRKRKPCMIGTGSMCDPYLPIEKDLLLMRNCLEIIDRYHAGVSVLTKSDLILRDLDIYASINKKSKCVLQMTLTTADDTLCSLIEPNVCVSSKRVEALKTIRLNAIETAVWFTPILPYINDTEQNIKGVIEMCREAGVDKIVYFGAGLTLREGNREYFYAALDKHFPSLSNIYREKYGNAYSILSEKAKALDALFFSLCEKYHIVCNIREIFDYLKRYEEKVLFKQLGFEDMF